MLHLLWSFVLLCTWSSLSRCWDLLTGAVTDTLSEEVPHPLDPPEHLLRLRLVCVLLDTCGQYFDKGSSKKKLDCFLTYFQVFLTRWLRDVAVCRK